MRKANPIRLVPLAFVGAIIVGAGLLMLPFSRMPGRAFAVLPEFFTSVSAVTMTGLTDVDTATYWTPFGQVVIICLIQLGGFGIMTAATLLTVLIGRQLGLAGRLIVREEKRSIDLDDVAGVLRRVGLIMLVGELVVAIVITIRFRVAYDKDIGQALWHGIFHAISAFNNAGFALESDSLIGVATDPWIIVPLGVAVIVGGLGFPVIIELLRNVFRPRSWSVQTRLTVAGTIILLVVGIGAFMAMEWTDPATLGSMSPGGKVVASFGGGVMPRTSGFAVIDYGQARQETLWVTDILMFVGGGSAGTAGGIKITTFFLLAYAVWSEVRGNEQVNIGRRSIGATTIRQALSVVLLGIVTVAGATLALLILSPYSIGQTLFESISAFATVGLTTGITGHLDAAGQVVLMILMFVGRVGTITVAASLALNTHPRLYRLPEERPIIG